MTTHLATIAAPWGPIRLAVSDRGLVGLSVLAPAEAFADDVCRRTGSAAVPGRSAMLDRTVEAVEAFLGGAPMLLEALPLDLALPSAWDAAVFAGVRAIPWGRVSSYGRVATAIGRRGAARAVGGSAGRNPIGLAIPCHRVIAGDGSIGGYGGDWFGSREELLAIKQELLGIEGVQLPAARLLG
jgi:AraC family transcriptional regulator of adaptative response/methylated-DNA-[protein]-cysteine methyltransferase